MYAQIKVVEEIQWLEEYASKILLIIFAAYYVYKHHERVRQNLSNDSSVAVLLMVLRNITISISEKFCCMHRILRTVFFL